MYVPGVTSPDVVILNFIESGTAAKESTGTFVVLFKKVIEIVPVGGSGFTAAVNFTE